MGAAASVRMIYSQALAWLKTYIDSDTYMSDFNAIDRDHDGGITYGELQKWILQKSKDNPEGSWHLFKDHPQVMQIAHKSAGMGIDTKSSSHAGKVVDVAEFRLLLMHLFSVSILLAHFEHADDMGSKQLGFDEFKKAVFTFCETHAHEHLTDEQIRDDFDLLDTNKSDTIGFVEVCSYCCKFIDPNFMRQPGSEDPASALGVKSSKILGVDANSQLVIQDLGDLGGGPKAYYESATVSQKNQEAFRGLAQMLEDEMEDADRLIAVMEEQGSEERVMEEQGSEAGGTTVDTNTDGAQAVEGPTGTSETIDSTLSV